MVARSRLGFRKERKAFGLSLLLGFYCACSAPDPTPTEEALQVGTGVAAKAPEYTGTDMCGDCHPDEADSWKGSHHDLAMQEATQETVLGDFKNTRFKYFGVTSTFFRRDEEFWVRTDGPKGELADFRIAYSFGVEPLQQYLIEFPDGRLQALSICWDTRDRSEGGQRWFHLYPDEKIDAADPLHWTGHQQNWNFMCAECHSTNLQKNYDSAENRFNTSWTELDVSCEACHGPASGHLRWLDEEGEEPNSGYAVSLRRDVSWVFPQGEKIASQETPTGNELEINVCAKCHSRRGLMHENQRPGDPLLQTYRPALLDPGLYFPDGQIQDEVYVWGSFLQSKMYKAGVTCTDCHSPHTLQTYGGSEQVCAVCHERETYYSENHHFHSEDSPGAKCVNCHMPTRNYMVVDDRRDHSFRIPRPDLSMSLGVPNACNSCHDDENAEWAVAQINNWLGGWNPQPHYGEVLQAGRENGPGALDRLSALASDAEQPTIVRATALTTYAGAARTAQLSALERGGKDPDPLLRWATARAAAAAAPEVQLSLVAHLLSDSIRLVREEAALTLSQAPPQRLTPDQEREFQDALAEYRVSQQLNADRPESHLNLGILAAQLQQFQQAETHYKAALKLDPKFSPAIVNLADLYKVQKRESEGEGLLRLGLSLVPGSAELNYALGLLLVRTERSAEALSYFRRAADQQPGNARFPYAYALALQSAGRVEEGLGLLRKALERHPFSREVLLALVTLNRDSGNASEAIPFLHRLIGLEPDDPQLQQLLAQLEAAR